MNKQYHEDCNYFRTVILQSQTFLCDSHTKQSLQLKKPQLLIAESIFKIFVIDLAPKEWMNSHQLVV